MTAIFQLLLISIAVIVVIAIVAEVTAFLGTLWDDAAGWVILFAGLAALAWGLTSHNELVAVASGIAVAADLIGIFFHLTDVAAPRRGQGTNFSSPVTGLAS